MRADAKPSRRYWVVLDVVARFWNVTLTRASGTGSASTVGSNFATFGSE